MGPAARVRVFGAAAEAVAARWSSVLGAGVATRGRELLGADVVIARVPVDDLRRVAALATLAGARAVIAAPIGPATRLPWWERRFHRYLLDGQDAARGWASAGVALGRLVVVAPGPDEGDALRAVVDEVRAMALRPDIRPRVG